MSVFSFFLFSLSLLFTINTWHSITHPWESSNFLTPIFIAVETLGEGLRIGLCVNGLCGEVPFGNLDLFDFVNIK